MNANSFAFQNFLRKYVFVLLILMRRRLADVFFPNFEVVTDVLIIFIVKDYPLLPENKQFVTQNVEQLKAQYFFSDPVKY